MNSNDWGRQSQNLVHDVDAVPCIPVSSTVVTAKMIEHPVSCPFCVWVPLCCYGGCRVKVIVEWRALTVCLLDEIAYALRQRLGKTVEEFPLVKVC